MKKLTMMKLYHEIQSDKLEDVRTHGLKIGPSGDKQDEQIKTTDDFLQRYIPTELKRKNVDRQANIFCYLPSNGKVIDIQTGESEEISDVSPDTKHVMLEIEVDPSKCFVSDLDKYDEIKHLLSQNNLAGLPQLAEDYWKSLTLLEEYVDDFPRPEAMVTYDIPPDAIKRVIFLDSIWPLR